jgi:tetratricopeptide (TPR) repeat protein
MDPTNKVERPADPIKSDRNRSSNPSPSGGGDPGLTELGFVQRRLPWIVGAAMLVLYLFTLSHWATPAAAIALAKVSGWDWRPDVVAPLHLLLKLPIRWLPAGIQLVALNLLEAVFAAGALALLVRSVSLLPHDRTKEQRLLERSDYSLLSLPMAWMPPVFAALVCGLQLTFWENAVVSNGEMLDLLLFAYLVRCLLEFRLDQDERWLNKLAVGYGLAMVNNYAMAGFFPAFLIALVWVKGMAFFNWRFVLRMTRWGCLGLLLYFLLPLVSAFSQSKDYSFWELLRSYWGLQKTLLASAPRYLLVFLAGTSLLPVLFIGIRWPASFGDISPIGVALTNFTTHVIHLIFLGICLFVSFDMEFSPRRILFGVFAGLPFYYLGALSIGYFAGYVLLVFGSKTDPNAKSWQRPSLVRRYTGMALVGVVWVLFVAVPGGLGWKNVSLLRANSGSALSQHAMLQADSLPAQPAIVLSDDPVRLYALQGELRKRTPQAGHILLESGALNQPAYHRFLARRYGARLPHLATNYPAGSIVDSPYVNAFLANLSQSTDLYYLHPSFGYFFEVFYLKPQRAVYQLKLFTTNSISGPVLTATELKAQDDFWRSLTAGELAPLLQPRPVAAKAAKDRVLAPDRAGVTGNLRMIYSHALNHFGVEGQRGGDFKLAGSAFDLALKFNDRNPTALINQEYNRRVQAGDRRSLPPSSNVVERMKYYGNAFSQMLNDNGPPDEPSACYVLAQHFHHASLYRQSAQWLERSLAFEPTNISYRIFLISECLQMGLADHTLALIADLRARPPVPLTIEDQIDLTRAEAWAHYSQRDLALAERLLRADQQKYPREAAPFSTLSDIYVSAGMTTNALAVYGDQLKVQPEDFSALVNLSALLIRSGRYGDALPFLERALKVKPNDPSALFNRALSHLNLAQLTAGKLDAPHLDAALADFLQLSAVAPNAPSAFWGIAESYRLNKNKNEALRYYDKFLEAAPPGDPDVPLARQRIQLLRSGRF